MLTAALFRSGLSVVSLSAALMVGCGSNQVQAAPSPGPTPVTSRLWLPKSGDLRFQGLGAYSYSQAFLGTGMPALESRTFPSYAGSPLQIGSGVCGPALQLFPNCYWLYSVDGPPTFKTTAFYTSGHFSGFDTDIGRGMQGSALVTSLDIQTAYDVYATAQVVSSADQTFKGLHQHVATADLVSTVQALTTTGSVVTALAPDSDQGFQVFSYTWGGDTSSKYEATVLTCPIADVGATFRALTAQGYILTALGGTRASEMRLVGTRLVGQMAIRPTLVSVDGKGLTSDPLKQGYVTVGFVFDDVLGNTVTRLLQQ
jgi:hypothetical protein